MNSIRPFSESRSRRIRSSESPFGPQGTKLSSGPQLALPASRVPALQHHALPVAGIAEPAERHARSRARWPRRASRRRAAAGRPSRRRGCPRGGGCAPVPGALDPVVRLPDGPHGPPLQGELGGLDDRLVAELQRVQAVPGVDRAAPPRSRPSPPGSSRARGPRRARARSRRARPPGRRSGRRRPARPRRPRGRRRRPCRSATRRRSSRGAARSSRASRGRRACRAGRAAAPRRPR